MILLKKDSKIVIVALVHMFLYSICSSAESNSEDTGYAWQHDLMLAANHDPLEVSEAECDQGLLDPSRNLADCGKGFICICQLSPIWGKRRRIFTINLKSTITY